MTIRARLDVLERRAAVVDMAYAILAARSILKPWPDAAKLLDDSSMPGMAGRIARARLRVLK